MLKYLQKTTVGLKFVLSKSENLLVLYKKTILLGGEIFGRHTSLSRWRRS